MNLQTASIHLELPSRARLRRRSLACLCLSQVVVFLLYHKGLKMKGTLSHIPRDLFCWLFPPHRSGMCLQVAVYNIHERATSMKMTKFQCTQYGETGGGCLDVPGVVLVRMLTSLPPQSEGCIFAYVH